LREKKIVFSFKEPFCFISSRGFSEDDFSGKDLSPALGAAGTREKFFRKERKYLLTGLKQEKLGGGVK